MKVVRKTLLSSLFAILMLLSGKSLAQNLTDVTLDGSVGKYPVVMEVVVLSNGPSILGGSYYYKSQGPKHEITLSDDLNFEGKGIRPRLEESVNGKVTGTFHASYWDMETMRGTWISADGSKQLPFKLKVIKTKRDYAM